MSLSFWFDLLLAALVFAAAIVFIHQYKYGAIRDFRARRLRGKMIPKLTVLLTVMESSLAEQTISDPFDLYRARADVESLIQQSGVLFSEERVSLADFMVMLSNYLAKEQAGTATRIDIEEAILAGQRAVTELKEIAS